MVARTPIKPAEILLVEDNLGDVRLTIEALNAGSFPTHLNIVRDGVEALAFLRREGAYHEAPRPAFILLDLNLPRKDGREVLMEIKSDPDLKRIPVLILTTSRAEEDILNSYDLHVNCYVTKPFDLNEFLRMARCLEEFWLTVVTLPPA